MLGLNDFISNIGGDSGFQRGNRVSSGEMKEDGQENEWMFA
jgi:hypothetical protein